MIVDPLSEFKFYFEFTKNFPSSSYRFGLELLDILMLGNHLWSTVCWSGECVQQHLDQVLQEYWSMYHNFSCLNITKNVKLPKTRWKGKGHFNAIFKFCKSCINAVLENKRYWANFVFSLGKTVMFVKENLNMGKSYAVYFPNALELLELKCSELFET